MLLSGQTHSTSCPYLWAHCEGSSCDGCEADRGQDNPSATPPWAKGTSIDGRHALARRAADAPDARLAKQLWQEFTWRQHILRA